MTGTPPRQTPLARCNYAARRSLQAWRHHPDRATLLRLLRAAAVTVAAVASAAAAQSETCDATALPPPGAEAPAATGQASGSAKFRLIAQQCPSLTTSSFNVEQAAQLDLYERGRSVTVPMGPPPARTGSGPIFSGPVTLPADPSARQGVRLDAAGEQRALRIASLAPSLTAAALEYGLDPLLLHALAHVESRHQPAAVSPAGARGLMQVMPPTGQRFGVGDAHQLFDAATNARAAAAYLAALRQRFRGDLPLMVAAYNAGEGAVERHGRTVPPYPETQAYVRQVLAVYERLSASFAVTPNGVLVARAGAAGLVEISEIAEGSDAAPVGRRALRRAAP